MNENLPNHPVVNPVALSDIEAISNAESLRAQIPISAGSVVIAAELEHQDSPQIVEVAKSQDDMAERMKKAERAFFGTPDNLIKQIDDGELDVNDTDFQDRTAVMMMTAQGHAETVRQLIARNADVNRINLYQGRIPMSALDAARQTGQRGVEQLLLENGAKSGRELKAEQDAAKQNQ